MRVGKRERCQVCGGRVVLTKRPRLLGLNTSTWVHADALRRVFATHAAEGSR